MDIKGKKINFLGDSITEGYGPSCIENTYWKLFERNDGCTVRGYGISGTRIAKQRVPDENPSFDIYFGSRVESMDPDADIVVVFGGTNDYGHGDAALGEFSDRTDDTFYGALHNLYIDLKNKYPNAQIVVMTPCHRVDEEDYYNSRGVRNVGTLKDYVDIICEVAAHYGFPVVDLYRESGLQPEFKVNCDTYFLPDGLHPANEGHKVIYSKLKGVLEAL